MRFRLLAACLLVVAGCGQTLVHPPSVATPADQADLFGPASMQLHPVFTQVKTWTGGPKPDGIEAVLQFEDQFGDPSKAAGSVIFELYDFRKGFPDDRGPRLSEPWTASLSSVDQQQAHWRREIEAYSFLLSDSAISSTHNYVLTATFEPLTGPRLFSKTVITGGHQPTSQPSPDAASN
ncbi:MAG: hypothetical protein ABSH22_20900 [Tepidisphaeraceae bacterium]|jgi:hypothetical protein